jgi:glycosyltransferase involved in cell wall biosynthesis
MKKLLSICNPIHNNGQAVVSLIRSLEDAMLKNPELSQEVEIVLFNNASTDGFQNAAQDFALTNKAAIYHNSHTLLSPVESVRQAVSHSCGKYVWIIGDDSLVEGGLRLVVENLKSKIPDFLIAHSIIVNADGNLTHRSLSSRYNQLPSIETVMASLGASLNHFFIGNHIIKKSLVESTWKKTTTNWPHIESMLSYLNSGGDKICLIQSDAVVFESASQWYSVDSRKNPKLNLARNNNFFELIEISRRDCTVPAAIMLQKQSRYLAVSNIVFLRAKMSLADILILHKRYGLRPLEIVRLCQLKVIFFFKLYAKHLRRTVAPL